MKLLKQSTQTTIKVGALVDNTDFKTPRTDIAYDASGMDVDIIKSDTTVVHLVLSDVPGDGYWVHKTQGMYELTLSADDTASLGLLCIVGSADGVLIWWEYFTVVVANSYNSFVAGSDHFDVTVDDKTGYSIAGTKQTLDALNDLNATAVKAQADQALVDYDAVVPADIAGLALEAGGNLEAVKDKTDQLAFTEGNIHSDIKEYNAHPAVVVSGVKQTLDDLNDIDAAQVKAEMGAALADINLDHFIPVSGLVSDAAATATDFDTDLTEATDDHYNDMVILFTGGNLIGQARRISDYDGTSPVKHITISPALTEAPADTDPFVIVSGVYLQTVAVTTDILNVIPLLPRSIDLADTATYRLGLMLANAVDDLPSTAEITPGTIDIDRKAIGGTTWVSVVADAACSESNGLVYYDEVFDSGTGYAEGDSIRITFKGQKITVAANDYEITDATGRIFYTEIRQTMRGTNSAFLAASAPTNFPSMAITAGGAITVGGYAAGKTPMADRGMVPLKRVAKKNSTNHIYLIFISDTSKTDGSGLTGLAYNSPNLVAYYVRPGDIEVTQITLANITTLGTYVSGGFKAFDAVNLPGVYEFHPPNTCYAGAAPSVFIMLKGATNMPPTPIEIQLVG